MKSKAKKHYPIVSLFPGWLMKYMARKLQPAMPVRGTL